jgi:hypothetical protein
MNNLQEQSGRRPLFISLQQISVITMDILACTTSISDEKQTNVNYAMLEAATGDPEGNRKESTALCKKWRAARSVPSLPRIRSYCQDFGLGHSTQAATTHQAAFTATACEKIDLQFCCQFCTICG